MSYLVANIKLSIFVNQDSFTTNKFSLTFISSHNLILFELTMLLYH